jgi:hypothetical protein
MHGNIGKTCGCGQVNATKFQGEACQSEILTHCTPCLVVGLSYYKLYFLITHKSHSRMLAVGCYSFLRIHSAFRMKPRHTHTYTKQHGIKHGSLLALFLVDLKKDGNKNPIVPWGKLCRRYIRCVCEWNGRYD